MSSMPKLVDAFAAGAEVLLVSRRARVVRHEACPSIEHETRKRKPLHIVVRSHLART